jgi:tRNA (guanosine-2'-O-)-methyltransferase
MVQKNPLWSEFSFAAPDVIRLLSPFVTEERKEKIENILKNRSTRLSLVLENIYDQGNVNAVMRTAENFGIMPFHLIESERTKACNRVSKGADQWLHLHHWKTSEECLRSLKNQGKKIVVTALDKRAVPFSKIDWQQPTALIIGNEKEGASSTALELADEICIIPTVGFSQSFNLSVATAIILSAIFQLKNQGGMPIGDLTQNELEFYRAQYYFNSYAGATKLLSATRKSHP